MACKGTVGTRTAPATAIPVGNRFRVFCLIGSLLLFSGLATGCGGIVSGFASNLSAAILDQDDIGLVRDGAPAYLLMLDSFVKSSPDDPEILGAAAKLYAVYGVAFVDDDSRAKRLTERSRGYGARALCAAERHACALEDRNFGEFTQAIMAVDDGSADALFSYCIGVLAYIRTHSDELTAIADLPKVELALQHLLQIGRGDHDSSINMYLGVLNSLRPPALGGKPEKAQAFFEKALELSHGLDLSVKVEYARGYARLVYDRPLHDRLLNEVLVADVQQPGLTLMNQLAQQQAADLLSSADEYF